MFGKSGSRLKSWAEAHHDCVRASKLDIIASTEHVYKNALEAYLFLRGAIEDLPVAVIPGVEWISAEKVEIIFLFDCESSLKNALKILTPFGRSVWDLPELRKDTGGLSVIPHPFTPGKTGAATNLGIDAFQRLLKSADYVEIHNGIARQFEEILFFNLLKPAFPALRRKLEYTDNLPERYRPDEIGWSVGSDAHFPWELTSAGVSENIDREDWFERLRERIHFTKTDLPFQKRPSARLKRNISNMLNVMDEARIKRRLRRGL
jgi:hypothetical protein